jgi:hyperosmotically inducible periplasmic protein
MLQLKKVRLRGVPPSMAWRAEAGKGGFMRRYGFALLGVLTLALLTVACGTSDPGITTKVKTRLETDRNINAAQVQVTTQNRVVTLSGPVDSPAAKERAVTLARGTEGVVDVVDNLSVSTAVAAMPAPGAEASSGTPATSGQAPDDTSITQAVKEKLLKQPETSAEKIDVNTHEGVVTLSGSVKSPEEKEQVIQIARNTEGVQRVEDKLSVGSSS